MGNQWDIALMDIISPFCNRCGFLQVKPERKEVFMILKDGQKIKEYIFIDRMTKGLGFIKAEEDEEIIGKVDYHGDHDEVFILHRRISDGIALRTVNLADVSQIVFDV
jgi:hypothetical protein